GSLECNGLQLTDVLDGLLADRPQSLELVHAYDQEPTDAFLIQEFFGTDFSRSYLALQTLQSQSPKNLWPLLQQRWDEEAHNDYGAHYFFIRLFGLLGPWPDEAQPVIRNLLNEAITTRRPQFMKSKPAAVLAMGAQGWMDQPGCFEAWLNPEITPFWEVRYAALMLAPAASASLAFSDPEPYVVAKAKLSTDGAF
ncbi:MAG: HEAT repeat domain-containing protein, partial [Cyanobacteria bacterium]|nr:HEAT repeat domain-containing protein [Cyanobacteriota bacterium]